MLDIIKTLVIGLLSIINTLVTPVVIHTNNVNKANNISSVIKQLTPAPINNVSANWSGYSVSSGKFTGVGATWSTPNNTSSSFGADATWVGIGGVKSTDLIQAGTQRIITRGGQTEYQAFYEMLPDYPHDLGITINPGDSVSVTVNQTTNNNWTIIFTDNTTKQHVSKNVYYNSSLSSAEWIEEAPSTERGVLPLDNFGSVQFSDGWVIKNGNRVSIKDANATSIAIASGDQILANASNIGNDGSSFNVTSTGNDSGTNQYDNGGSYSSYGQSAYRRGHHRITIYFYGS
jgi:hypothetical protein